MKVRTTNGPEAGTLFILIFFYALCMGIFVQLLVLPVFIPGLHAGHGLLKGGDWVTFYNEAVILAHRIQSEGWQTWELRPLNNAPIGIAAAIFAATGIYEPWVILPVNAALFAVGGLSLYLIFSCLASQRQAWMATLSFVLFPSASMIYGQIHKDVWSIAGTLLLTLVWVRFSIAAKPGRYRLLGQVALTALAALMVWLVRPYLVGVLLVSSAVALLAMVLMNWGEERQSVSWWAGVVLCLGIIIVFMKLPAGSDIDAEGANTGVATIEVGSTGVASTGAADTGVWPSFAYVEQLNYAREGFAEGYPHAGSNIDKKVSFESAGDLFSYVPRALQIGFFAPFPTMWVESGISPGARQMRLISGVEMAVAYVLFFGVTFLFFSPARMSPTMVVLIQAVLAVLVMALVVCNIGTLYRMRYGAWHLMTGLGVIGWSRLIGMRREQNEG